MKSRLQCSGIVDVVVAPAWGRGLKSRIQDGVHRVEAVATTWGRGLKSPEVPEEYMVKRSPPHGGVD